MFITYPCASQKYSLLKEPLVLQHFAFCLPLEETCTPYVPQAALDNWIEGTMICQLGGSY